MPEPIQYDPRGVYGAADGELRGSRAEIMPRLDAARRETLADVELYRSGQTVPAEKRPLDAAFIDLPQRLLDDYHARKDGSDVGRMLAATDRLASEVDRVVVLGIGGSYMGARVLFEALCHPYHNELTRSRRGGRPRLYFAGNNVDPVATSGLLDLLSSEPGDSMENAWGLVVVSKSGGTLETAVAFRLFLDALRRTTSGAEQTAARILPVTGTSGKLFELSEALGCAADARFEVPDGVGGRFSILSAVGLLPAAVLGLDIVALLEGAADLTRRFRENAAEQDPVLEYVAASHLMETERAATIRVLSCWADGLEAVGLWYDQLLAESLGKELQGATPLTTVNTRDLHSRHQQHQQGRRDKLITNLTVRQPADDRLQVGTLPGDEDELNRFADATLGKLLSAAQQGTNEALAGEDRPTAELCLPALDEHALGQLVQMLMLATAVEGRLIGINPYGQPGVQAYKENMLRILGEKT